MNSSSKEKRPLVPVADLPGRRRGVSTDLATSNANVRSRLHVQVGKRPEDATQPDYSGFYLGFDFI